MNQEPESFRPVSSVQDILEGLQEQSMGWMAEEIADHIREGRALSEDATLFGVKRRSTTPSHMTIPFSAEDQMRIALMTVVRYVVETYDTWNLAIQGLRDILGSPNLSVEVTLPDSEELVPMFSIEYTPHVTQVLEWARSYWPDGPEVFDEMIRQLRGMHL